MSTVKENRFYWNEETLEHFKFNSNYQNKEEVIKEITLFVENECSLENNETEEDLIKDLIKQVYNK
jgi:mannitol/fructose-specific phosphotransferase system IIA component (Ntr-type)|tara:strand:+ start:408 stop:605 length:198 start_codon:yes stop_codon:yes gene_type:complete